MKPETSEESFAVFVTWTACEGEEDAVGRLLEQLAKATRAEPGCLAYVVHRSREEPSRYAIYERYVDEESFQRHIESDHFRVLALEDGIPRLASRTRESFAVVA